MNVPCLKENVPTIKVEATSIHRVLLNIGVPHNLLGYSYTLYAMELILLNPNYLRGITKGLYIDIAVHFGTTPSRVERAIRHSITVAWLHGNIDFINLVFKNSINPKKGVPTNSHYLSALYYYLITTTN